MRWEAWVLIFDLLFSGLIIFGSGLTHRVRHYDWSDAFFGAAEIATLIWLVTRLAS